MRTFEFNEGKTVLVVELGDESKAIPALEEVERSFNKLSERASDYTHQLRILKNALARIAKHGCCVMHNDSGCPGCEANAAILLTTKGAGSSDAAQDRCTHGVHPTNCEPCVDAKFAADPANMEFCPSCRYRKGFGHAAGCSASNDNSGGKNG